MKKYWKLLTTILTSSMLISSGAFLLSNGITNQTNNQTFLNEFNNLQSGNVQVINNIEFTTVEAGPGNFAIARDAVKGDQVYAWGNNGQGQLGVGDVTNKTVPTKVAGLPNNANIKWIKSGAEFTLIVLADNSIWATGMNNYGQFGNGSTSSTAITTFTNVQTFKKEIIDIDVGSSHAALVTTNDAGGSVIYSWGYNKQGQLGIGGTTNQSLPSEVKSLTGKHIGKLKLSGTSCFISVLGNDNSIESIYAWGNNSNWRLGIEDKLNKDLPTLITYSFKGKVTDYYPGYDRVYFTSYDSSVSKNYVYGCGSNVYKALGVGTGLPSFILEISSIPNSIKIANIYVYTLGTFVLTSTGDVYSCGNPYISTRELDDDNFHEVGIHGVISFFGSVAAGADNVTILANNLLYAWGYSSYGGYGNGNKNIVMKTPTLVDPFSSTPSSLKQIKTDNNLPVSEIAKLMYDETTGINLPFVNEWVQTADFPADAVLTMKTAPVVDDVKKEIALTISASRSYSAPDGAKTLDVDFPITLTGFKAVPDSALTIKGNKPWIYTFKYENIKTELGEGKTTNLDNLKKIYDFSSFPDTAEYAISEPNVTFNPSTRKGTYTAKLTVSQYYLGDKLLTTGKEIVITMDGFDVKPDSSIIQKPGIDTNKYNLTSIDRVLCPNGVLSETVLKDLFAVSDFPDNATFTVDKSEIVGTDYNVSIIASQAWVNGFIKDNVKFEKTITGLNFQPDSTVTLLTINPLDNFNLQNIDKRLVVDGIFGVMWFDILFRRDDFPKGATFTPKDNRVDGDKYLITVVASNAWKDGSLVPDKEFQFVVTDLLSQPDSTITPLSLDKTHFNANNIIGLLFPNNDTVLERNEFDKLFTTENFFTGNKITASNPKVEGTTFSMDVNATHAYTAGEISTRVFPLNVTGLDIRDDSAITLGTVDQDIFNFENIEKKLFPTGSLDNDIFKTIVVLSNFDGSETFAATSSMVDGVYTLSVTPSKAWKAGFRKSDITFTLPIDGLVSRPDSTITVKPDAMNYFNANNIVNAINKDGNGTVDMNNLKSICDIGNFPTDNIFTISNDTVVNKTYNATISASKYYLDGNVTPGPETFAIHITGLTEVPDSDLKVKSDAKDKFNANNIINAINPEGKGTIDDKNFKSICDLVNFPSDNILTIKSNKVDGTTYTATLNATKYYFGGNLSEKGKEFTIQVTGLQLRPNSTIIAKTPSPDELDDIISKLKAGEAIDSMTLGKLIDTSYFPKDTVFIIDTVDPDKDNSNIKFTFTPDKVYKDGNIVNNTGADKLDFNANVKFVLPVEPTVDNTWLLIGLSIVNGALLLFVIWSIIRIIKRKN